MNTVLVNSRYRAEVAPLGAELQSLRDRRNGYELLWQGDPSVWAGRSPLLFPVVGRVREDCHRLGGQSYPMPKHGFARDATFIARKLSPTRACFTLTDTSETRRMYPFPFELTVLYRLTPRGLMVLYGLRNPGDSPLPFMLGAHPGLNCEPGDSLLFKQRETALAHRLDINKLLTPADTPIFLPGGRKVPITATLFDRGALILEGVHSRKVALIRPRLGQRVTLAFSRVPPSLGLWAFPGAPYVCVEPWHGLDDTPGPVRPLADRPHTMLLAPGQRFGWSMILASEPL